MDTTTIEIRSDQKDELDSLKVTDGESYKSVIARLIESHSQDNQENVQLGSGYEEIARRIAESLNDMQDNDRETQAVATRQLMNRLDELPEETARKTEDRLR